MYQAHTTGWIFKNGNAVFYVPKPETCEYADNQAHAHRLHIQEVEYIAACLNAGRSLPKPELCD